jgi:hypothetical protein
VTATRAKRHETHAGTTTRILGKAGEFDMFADAKRKHAKGEAERQDGERRRRQEEALDDALSNTFPASDPVSIEQPAPVPPKRLKKPASDA